MIFGAGAVDYGAVLASDLADLAFFIVCPMVRAVKNSGSFFFLVCAFLSFAPLESMASAFRLTAGVLAFINHASSLRRSFSIAAARIVCC